MPDIHFVVDDPDDFDSVYYQLPSSTMGQMTFSLLAGNKAHVRYSFTSGEPAEIVFQYDGATTRKLYRRNMIAGRREHLNFMWNLSSSSLTVFYNDTLQTVRLPHASKPDVIDGLIIENMDSDTNVEINLLGQDYKSARLADRLRVVAFGNSTTAYRNTITQVYAQRLPELLAEKGIANTVFNEGVGGSHTGKLSDNQRHKVQHARDRFITSVLERDPDIVIICFGLNDSWMDEGRSESRIPLGDYRNNLQWMIDELKQRKVEIILMTPNAIGSRFEQWRTDNTLRYVEVMRGLAEDNNLLLIDQWAMFENYAAKEDCEIDGLLLDGIHPNDRWHEMLAEKLTNEIYSLNQ